MSTPQLVADFYERLWHRQERDALRDILDDEFVFRGSLGSERRGQEQFWAYLKEVHAALGDYRCEILGCVAEGNAVFAQMEFSGRHRGVFRGYPPTQHEISWKGAAYFRFRAGRIASLWVLGDLWSLEEMLKRNARP
ncbi:MAG: ester cyclase [Opitutae bacterium]|nr:ester cyclase [Opitutae bacterium]